MINLWTVGEGGKGQGFINPIAVPAMDSIKEILMKLAIRWMACLALVAALALRLLVAIQHGWKFSWRIPQAVEALDEA